MSEVSKDFKEWKWCACTGEEFSDIITRIGIVYVSPSFDLFYILGCDDKMYSGEFNDIPPSIIDDAPGIRVRKITNEVVYKDPSFK